MTTGQRMKKRRKEIGLSAERVAMALGVSPATVYRYENGDIEKVPGDLLEPIAAVLQTTPSALMGWEENPKIEKSLGSRINDIRKEKNFSIDELCVRSGVPKGTFSKITAGITTNPTLDTVQAIAKALDCRLDDLDDSPHIKKNAPSISDEAMKLAYDYDNELDQWGQKQVRSTADIEIERIKAEAAERLQRSKKQSVGHEEAEHITKIIYLSEPLQPASAGTGDIVDDDTAEQIAVYYNHTTAKADYIMRVHGDSMEPAIMDGDRVLVRTQPAVEIGELGIFIRENERYIKIFQGNYLKSLNPAYSDVSLDEYSRCVGKVISVLKPEWIAE